MTFLRFLAAPAVLVSVACLAGCAGEPAAPAASQHVDGGTRMPASGLDGWQFHRVLRFGDYATSPVIPKATNLASDCLPDCPARTTVGSPGHVPVYRKQFDEAFRSATVKVQFDQHGPDAQSAPVHALYEARRYSDVQMTEWMGFPTSIKGRVELVTSFTGVIDPLSAGQSAWHFALLSDNTTDAATAPAGWLVDDSGRSVVIRHAPFPVGTPAFVIRLARGVSPGYLFDLDGQVVGSMSLFPEKTVWLRDDLAPDLRFALAGLSSALFLQPQSH